LPAGRIPKRSLSGISRKPNISSKKAIQSPLRFIPTYCTTPKYSLPATAAGRGSTVGIGTKSMS
jgi:hypothetical protein